MAPACLGRAGRGPPPDEPVIHPVEDLGPSIEVRVQNEPATVSLHADGGMKAT
jgi:hypothetical protein